MNKNGRMQRTTIHLAVAGALAALALSAGPARGDATSDLKHEIWGGSTNIIFKLESEFDYQTGEEDTPGVLFNRDAWIGFQSEALGKLTFGRQNALARDFTGIYGDPYTSARVTLEEGGYTNVNNFKQLIFYAASATGTRYDRGMVWKKDFGGFVAGVGYSVRGRGGVLQHRST